MGEKNSIRTKPRNIKDDEPVIHHMAEPINSQNSTGRNSSRSFPDSGTGSDSRSESRSGSSYSSRSGSNSSSGSGSNSNSSSGSGSRRVTDLKEKQRKESKKIKGPEPRVQKLLGLACILASIILFISFISYFLSWNNDQDIVKELNADKIFHPAGYHVGNWLGVFGAFLSHLFIYEGFGIASFAFVFILVVAGYRLLFSEHLITPFKAIGNTVFFLLFVSVLTAYISGFVKQEPQILGGVVGYQTTSWLNASIGITGTAFLLIFSGLGWVIYVFNVELKSTWFVQGRAGGLNDPDYDSGFNPDYDEKNGSKGRSSGSGSRLTDIHVFDPGSNSPARDPLPKIIHDLESDETTIIPAGKGSVKDIPMTIHRLDVENEEELRGIDDARNQHSNLKNTDQPGSNPGYVPGSTSGYVPGSTPESAASRPLVFAGSSVNHDPGLTLTVERNETEKKHAEVIEKYGVYDSTLDLSTYKYPEIFLLEEHGSTKIQVTAAELEQNKNKIVKTLEDYDIGIDKIKATIGPSVTLYEIIPKAGVRISKIKNLEDDIALNLAALGIRIIAPIPGKGTIGIEVPNLNPEIVSMRSVFNSDKYKNTDMDLPIALGKTITNEVYVADLARMPHLLMAGATGQGKSVGINALLVSLLYKKHPSQLKFVLVDPKKVELTLYRKIERHFLAMLPGEDEAIITDTKKVINTLNSLCIEMDLRYTLLKDAGVRNLKEYNQKFINRKLNPEEGHRFLPFIVLVIDEFADLMMTAGKEIETPIARLAQLARAIGIHLVVATQRPSVNIITGTIKANFPARLAFRVTSKIDSRTILDSSGAEQLVGRGDMLLSTGNDLIRLQCAFVDTPEVEKITDFIGSQRGYATALQLPEYAGEEGESRDRDMDSANLDPLFKDAARLIVLNQQGSTSLIQRKLQLGYNRAGRIIDQLEQAGIVGKFEGSKARAVLYPDEHSLEEYLETMEKNS